MKPIAPLLALLVATIAVPTDACAQARGPDAAYVQEYGQEILSRREREQQEAEQEAVMDEATRQLRLQEMDAWLRRLPGRYRINGQAVLYIPRPQSGSVDGIADCSGIGSGLGVSCIINAWWPLMEHTDDPTNTEPSPTEYLNTMRPSVLVFGMSLDPPRIVSQMVLGDSVMLDWSGKLEEDTLAQKSDHRCANRCIGKFDVTAAAESERVTFEMLLFDPDKMEELDGFDGPGSFDRSGSSDDADGSNGNDGSGNSEGSDESENVSGIADFDLPVGLGNLDGYITFSMKRDPDARAEKPLRALKSR